MNEPQNWERQVVERLAFAAIDEQRRARRWKIFFRAVWLTLFIAGVVTLMLESPSAKEGMHSSSGQHTAVVDLVGPITSENNTAERLILSLNKAFEDAGTKAVLVRANSPGGSPVLSGMVYDEIRRLRTKYPAIPLYFVVEEVCASGCYYMAAAADRIYVDKASIIGSIGVLSDGFGFPSLMEKLGVERRLMTAGTHKALGDPFSPQKPEDAEWRQQLLDGIHQQFIDAVKLGRGKRLANNPALFSGLVWLGSESVPMGLADGLGSVNSVARDVIKVDELMNFTTDEYFIDRFAKRIGVSLKYGVTSFFDTSLR